MLRRRIQCVFILVYHSQFAFIQCCKVKKITINPEIVKKGSRGLWPGRCCRTQFFERLTSTGSDAFSLLIFLDGTKIVLVDVFSLVRHPLPFILIPESLGIPLAQECKTPLLVNVRHWKVTHLISKVSFAYKLPSYLCTPHDTFIKANAVI